VVESAEPKEDTMTDADTARRNGWTVGTRLAGDEGYGETIIEITAIGESKVLAKTISHNGNISHFPEGVWTFSYRTWRVFEEAS